MRKTGHHVSTGELLEITFSILCLGGGGLRYLAERDCKCADKMFRTSYMPK